MSFIEAAEDALVWIGRAVSVLPAFKALWQAVSGGSQDQSFAAAMELCRAMREQQARAEIGQPSTDDEP